MGIFRSRDDRGRLTAAPTTAPQVSEDGATFQVLKVMVADQVRERVASDLRSLMATVDGGSPGSDHFLAGLEAAHEVVLGHRLVPPRGDQPSLF